MKDLEKITTMSSREIAELTNKQHKNVLADCDKLNESYRKLGVAEILAGVYTHPNTGKQQHREFLLTKIQCLDLMTGYDAELRIKVNRRWAELESEAKSPEMVMARGLMAAQCIIDRQAQRLQIVEGRNELLTKENEALAPKAEYTDKVLQSTTTYTMTQVAKEFGMSAHAFSEKLHKKGVLFNQSGQWMLYAKYQNSGYAKPRTHQYTKSDGTTGTNTITVWTETGRKFLHELFEYQSK
jgi:phage antirepressor YoqD-like protein